MSPEIRIDVGDGLMIEMDMAPSHVMAAMLRMRDALDRGEEPNGVDGCLVFEWLEEQEDKYPTPRGTLTAERERRRSGRSR